MDLQTMKTQMNAVIQKHQIVVSEMRNDPQNPILQKRLHELQIEIASLNARQQQIFNEVRKKIGHSSPDSTCATTNTSGFSSASSLTPPPQASNQEIRMVCCAQKCPMANHMKMQTAATTTTTLVSKPVANCVNTVRQTVPPSLNNIISSSPAATITFKGPLQGTTVVLPTTTTTMSNNTAPTTTNTTTTLLSASHHHHHHPSPKVHPVLVVPSPSNRSVDGPQTGVLLNLVPPIRVPQYPPPSSPRTTLPGTVTACHKPHVANNMVSVTVSSSVVCNSIVAEQTSRNAEKRSPTHSPEKINNKIDQKKKEFIAALGLVSRDSLCDLKSKRTERKRRSTANPHFSNAALEEKWKNAALAATNTTPAQGKRPRGRPRLESKPVVCPTNGICTTSDSPKTEPLSPPPDTSNTVTTSITCTTSITTTTTTTAATVAVIGSTAVTSAPSSVVPSPSNTSSTLMNGVHRQTASLDEGKNVVEQMLSGLCIVCTQPGDLVRCDTCAKQQHPGCMQPPLVTRPQGPWQCTDCQSVRTESLTLVQSYDVLKAAKEDEKRKLLKKSLELRLKRSQLEARLLQLKDLSGKQKNRQSELQSSLKNVELLTDRIHSVISGVKLYS